jgi:acid phosphatase
MGRLLEDLSRKMQHKAFYGSRDPLKILVHSTHDTAIAGLCSTLDVFDDRSVLVFGLVMVEAHNTTFFKKDGPPSRHL